MSERFIDAVAPGLILLSAALVIIGIVTLVEAIA